MTTHTHGKKAQLFTPLGHHRHLFYFRTSLGKVMWFDSAQITRQGPALALLPDVTHWATMYPKGERATDWAAAGADLMRMAQLAGEYEPKPDEGPRVSGQRGYTASERLQVYLARQQRRKVSTLRREAQRETPAG